LIDFGITDSYKNKNHHRYIINGINCAYKTDSVQVFKLLLKNDVTCGDYLQKFGILHILENVVKHSIISNANSIVKELLRNKYSYSILNTDSKSKIYDLVNRNNRYELIQTFDSFYAKYIYTKPKYSLCAMMDQTYNDYSNCKITRMTGSDYVIQSITMVNKICEYM